jgi:outer membrane protein insertion porin family
MSEAAPVVEVEVVEDVPIEHPGRIRPPLHNTSHPRDKEPDEKDMKRLREWQRERLERRLKGEYESAVIRLGEIVSFN